MSCSQNWRLNAVVSFQSITNLSVVLLSLILYNFKVSINQHFFLYVKILLIWISFISFVDHITNSFLSLNKILYFSFDVNLFRSYYDFYYLSFPSPPMTLFIFFLLNSFRFHTSHFSAHFLLFLLILVSFLYSLHIPTQ